MICLNIWRDKFCSRNVPCVRKVHPTENIPDAAKISVNKETVITHRYVIVISQKCKHHLVIYCTSKHISYQGSMTICNLYDLNKRVQEILTIIP